jgi:hypothetical protein
VLTVASRPASGRQPDLPVSARDPLLALIRSPKTQATPAGGQQAAHAVMD